VLTRLLDRSDRLTRSGWSREVVESGALAAADLVVLDVPRAGRAATLQQLRGHYRGPLVVLVERGARGLRADQACALLARPFSTDDLKAALDVSERRATRPAATRPPPPAAADAPATLAGKAPTLVAPPAGTGGVVAAFPAAGGERAARRLGVAADGTDAATQAPPRPDAQPGAVPSATPRPRRLERLLAGLVHGWRANRTVRIAGFAGLAAVAFMVAFVLAGPGRCGPGCDPLTGVTPVSTLPAVAGAPGTPTTVRRLPPTTTTAPPGSGLSGAPVGVLGSSTSTTARRATPTTARGSVTTRSTTTRSTTTTSTSTSTTTSTTTTTIVTP
jgi:hypothetical protein